MTFPEKSPYKPDTAASLLAQAEAFAGAYAAPDWVQALRKDSIQSLAVQGLPGATLERFKYTNLPSYVKDLTGQIGTASFEVNDLTLVNSLENANKNAPEWLKNLQTANPAGESQYKDRALWHLNNIFTRDGLVIDIPAGKISQTPVKIAINAPEGPFSVARTIIRLGEGAELTLIETHGGDGFFWNNHLTQIIVGKNAKLHHYRIQDYGDNAVYTQNTHVQIERDATYEAFTCTLGAGMSRNQIHAELQGVNGTCNLYGINLLEGKQLGDTTITIEHKAPHCNSNQFYRTVLKDRAHGVFQGKVHVHQPAQKTDGYQLSNALILSEGAEMSTKPELEIYADDVKCSHGATTGQLDENALFYLRSRGLDKEEAQALLVEAFVAAVVDRLADKSVNDSITQRVQSWLVR